MVVGLIGVIGVFVVLCVDMDKRGDFEVVLIFFLNMEVLIVLGRVLNL